MPAIQKPKPFSLCGGHATLDFVNTLDNRFRDSEPDELLPSYDDLLRFMEESGLLSAAQTRVLSKAVSEDAAERALCAARELREATATVLYEAVDGASPQPAAIQILERHFHDAERHQQLRWSGPTKKSPGAGKMIWDWKGYDMEAQLPVWLLACETSGLLTSDAMSRLRSCGIETCRWLFLDTSKNHSRRWCDMKVCGNRMKARRFQARR